MPLTPDQQTALDGLVSTLETDNATANADAAAVATANTALATAQSNAASAQTKAAGSATQVNTDLSALRLFVDGLATS